MLGVVLGFWMLEDGFNFRVMVVGACFGALGGMVLEPTTRDRAPSTPRPIPQVQAPSARHTVLGSWVLGFGFLVLALGFWVLDAWCWVLVFRRLAFGVGRLVLCAGCRYWLLGYWGLGS